MVEASFYQADNHVSFHHFIAYVIFKLQFVVEYYTNIFFSRDVDEFFFYWACTPLQVNSAASRWLKRGILSGWKLSSHLSDHPAMLLISFWSRVKYWGLEIGACIFISSAKRWMIDLTTSGRSLMQMANRIGPFHNPIYFFRPFACRVQYQMLEKSKYIVSTGIFLTV